MRIPLRVGVLVCLSFGTAGAADAPKGAGLPTPRFVSLKSDRVNVRQGPARDHALAWTFTKRGLPVEIVAEFDVWRRVRDSDGAEGWVFHSLLSGERTALVAPWTQGLFDLRRAAEPDSPVVARLHAKVLVKIESCDGRWCEASVADVSGFINQESLWGVYPNEKLD